MLMADGVFLWNAETDATGDLWLWQNTPRELLTVGMVGGPGVEGFSGDSVVVPTLCEVRLQQL